MEESSMANKRKIKSRKDRLAQYHADIVDIPRGDPFDRLVHCLGDKLTEDKMLKILKRKEIIENQLTYSCFKITYYEYPINSERPRSRAMGGFVTNYVPNAKENKKFLEGLIKDLKKEIKIIHTPIYLKCDSYHPMPEAASVEEKVLFEMGILNPAMKPDFDNMIKAYTDMMIEKIILDDDLIYKALIQKHYSFLPRVEMSIYYEDQFASKYVYDRIRKRETFKRLQDHMEVAHLL
jgi:Holliday junction resolvase RusA-like endonuclease